MDLYEKLKDKMGRTDYTKKEVILDKDNIIEKDRRLMEDFDEFEWN